MYKHCTTEESAYRQRQLEGCLLNLMRDLPYGQITISHICDQAGISRKSFYRYFSSKEGCLVALIDHSIIDGASFYLPEHFEPAQLHGLYERFFSYWKKMEPLLDVLHRNNLSIHLVERMVNYVDREERDFHKYLGGTLEDSYSQILFMISGLMGLVLNWHQTGYQKTAAQMAAIMGKILKS